MKLNKGKPLHCAETVTGLGLTGTLVISEEDLRVELFSYSEFFHIKTDRPVHLISENSECVSLHGCIDGGSGHRLSYDHTTYNQSLVANVAVVGPDPWTETDRVKCVSFSVKHTMELLRSRHRIDGLGKGRFPSEVHLKLFENRVKGMTLGARYGGTWGSDFDSPKELWPIFEIEFDEPQDIHSYIEHVSSYVNFLSFCLGVKLRPHNIFIHRLSREEIVHALEGKKYRSPHEVHYVWPETEIDSRDLWVGGSPVRAWDEEELSAFRACLVAWMERAELWRKPNVMMMSSFKLKREISAERLINACRWFEDMPNAQSRNALSAEDAEAIVSAATARSEELGYAALRERIATSIARVKEETAAERFTRLIALIETKFGKGILPENALTHLRKAIQFRGRTAHGHFNPDSDAEYRAFSKATHAMEALCILLTALDLPVPEEGTDRIRSNPPVRDYLEAFE